VRKSSTRYPTERSDPVTHAWSSTLIRLPRTRFWTKGSLHMSAFWLTASLIMNQGFTPHSCSHLLYVTEHEPRMSMNQGWCTWTLTWSGFLGTTYLHLAQKDPIVSGHHPHPSCGGFHSTFLLLRWSFAAVIQWSHGDSCHDNHPDRDYGKSSDQGTRILSFCCQHNVLDGGTSTALPPQLMRTKHGRCHRLVIKVAPKAILVGGFITWFSSLSHHQM
jgi:hypothetical protein